MTSVLNSEENSGEYDPEFGDAWDFEVHCEVCRHVHGSEEECTPDEPNLPIGRSCGNPKCCPTDPDACEFVYEAWGPHPGCAEFMDQPDEFPCGEKATVTFAFNDHWYQAMTGEDGRDELRYCAKHAAEFRADPGEGMEIIEETSIRKVVGRA